MFETTIIDWVYAWDKLCSGLLQHGEFRQATAAKVTRFIAYGLTPYASTDEIASP